jgi:pyrroline-5-carboxylate reductase
MSLLIVGYGKMGSALAKRWASNANFKVSVIDPFADIKSAPKNICLHTSPDELAGQSFDALFIALKPQVIAELLPVYLPYLKSDGCLFSIAAGFSMRSLGEIAGGIPIVRMMPNLPAEIGYGVTGFYPNEFADEGHCQMAKTLTEVTGFGLQVSSEEDLDKVTAVAGSGTGYGFEIIRSWIEATVQLGLSPTVARELVLATMEGAVELAKRKPDSLAILRNSVTSPAGTTEAGLAVLRENEVMETLMINTVNAALQRAIELR